MALVGTAVVAIPGIPAVDFAFYRRQMFLIEPARSL
jgi:hypothetical protein